MFFGQTTLCIIFLIAFIIVYSNHLDPCIAIPNGDSSLNKYYRAAVATDAIPCAELGNEVLYVRGGNVIDALVVAQLCNGMVNMHSMGVGGGFFLVYYDAATNKSYALDAREVAPKAATKDMFANVPELHNTHGPLAIAVPGEMHGLYAAHQRFGKLKWRDLLQPAINLAEKGIMVHKELLHVLVDKPWYGTAWNEPSLQVYQRNFKQYVTDPRTQKFYNLGERLKSPKLAEMLRLVANDPGTLRRTDANGWNGRIYQDLKDVGSIITAEDLANYQPRWRNPFEMPIQTTGEDGKTDFTHVVHGMPPPSSGSLVAFAINVMSSFHYRNADCLSSCVTAGKFFHRLVETMKVAMNRRNIFCDEDFDRDKRVQQMMQKLSSIEYAKKWAKKFQTGETFEPQFYADSDQPNSNGKLPEKPGTSHLSLLGPDGSAVSVTSTLNTAFGSLIMGERSGILFNNQMDDFSQQNEPNIYQLLPAPQNGIEPGKRPMSSMSPIIVTDAKTNKVHIVAGASGGSAIVPALIGFTSMSLHLKLDMKKAIDMPRLHHQWVPDYISTEENFPGEVTERLTEFGHDLFYGRMPKTVIQAIQVNPCEEEYCHMIEANADHRKGGGTSGF